MIYILHLNEQRIDVGYKGQHGAANQVHLFVSIGFERRAITGSLSLQTSRRRNKLADQQISSEISAILPFIEKICHYLYSQV
jgi:hypothetical protein